MLADTGPSQRAKDLAQAVKDHFIPNTCGLIEPEILENKVYLSHEIMGQYDQEEAYALATEIFRKADELKAGDKNQQENPA